MPKDINIHVKTTGAEFTKEQLAQIKEHVAQLGYQTNITGKTASGASDSITSSFRKIAGVLGIGAIDAALIQSAVKVAQFFDELKKRTDDAVRNVADIRKGYDDLFEVMGAYSESARVATTLQTTEILAETAVPKDIGVPVITAYSRQFKDLISQGRLTQEQYDRGLKEMVSFAGVWGKAATPDLISLMAGWGAVTPESQGIIRRQIRAASEAAGLTDEELIDILAKSAPAIETMGWTPQQGIQAVAQIAAGQAGTKKMRMPPTVMQAVAFPQLDWKSLERFGLIPADAQTAVDQAVIESAKQIEQAKLKAGPKAKAGDETIKAAEEAAKESVDAAIENALGMIKPEQLLEQIRLRRPAMQPSTFARMVSKIYSAEAAPGIITRLLEAPPPRMAAGIEQAAAAAPAEKAAMETYTGSLEGMRAKTEMNKEFFDLLVTTPQKQMESIRKIGAGYQAYLKRTQPVRQWLSELFVMGNQGEQEEAAFRLYMDALAEEELPGLTQYEYVYPGQPMVKILRPRYERMSPKEKLAALERAKRRFKVPPGVLETTEPPQESPPIEGPETPNVPPPATEGPPTSQHFDNRTINYQIFNPVTGMNKQDLGIEPPHLA